MDITETLSGKIYEVLSGNVNVNGVLRFGDKVFNVGAPLYIPQNEPPIEPTNLPDKKSLFNNFIQNMDINDFTKCVHESNLDFEAKYKIQYEIYNYCSKEIFGKCLTRLDNLDVMYRKINNIDDRLYNIASKVSSTDTTIDLIHNNVGTVMDKSDSIRNKCRKLKSKMNDIERDTSYCKDDVYVVKKKCRKLKSQLGRANIDIDNVDAHVYNAIDGINNVKYSVSEVDKKVSIIDDKFNLLSDCIELSKGC